MNVTELTDAIHAALLQALGPSDAAIFARAEAEDIAETLARVTALRDSGTLDETDAAALVRMQASRSRAVLLAVQGMSEIDAQNAINAALDAVKDRKSVV